MSIHPKSVDSNEELKRKEEVVGGIEVEEKEPSNENEQQKEAGFLKKAANLFSNPEIRKQFAKSMIGSVASIAGVKAIYDVPKYFSERWQVRGMFGKGKGLTGSMEELLEASWDNHKRIASDGGESTKVRDAIKDLNKRLDLTKEGSEKGSEQRKKMAQLLRENRNIKIGDTQEDVSFENNEEDFSYNGASEGYSGTEENKKSETVDTEKRAYGEEDFAMINSEDLIVENKETIKAEKNQEDLEGGIYDESISVASGESFSEAEKHNPVVEEKIKWAKNSGNEVAIKMVAEYEQKREMNLETSRAKMTDILDNYTTTKTTGMQAMRETLNTACVASGALALRPLGYGLMDAMERFQRLNKESNIKTIAGEAADAPKFWRDVIAGSIKETYQEAFLKNADGDEKSKMKKGLDFVKAWGKIARYAGMGAMVSLNPEKITGSIESALGMIEGQQSLSGVGNNFQGNFEKVTHVSLFSGQEGTKSSFETVYAQEHLAVAPNENNLEIKNDSETSNDEILKDTKISKNYADNSHSENEKNPEIKTVYKEFNSPPPNEPHIEENTDPELGNPTALEDGKDASQVSLDEQVVDNAQKISELEDQRYEINSKLGDLLYPDSGVEGLSKDNPEILKLQAELSDVKNELNKEKSLLSEISEEKNPIFKEQPPVGQTAIKTEGGNSGIRLEKIATEQPRMSIETIDSQETVNVIGEAPARVGEVLKPNIAEEEVLPKPESEIFYRKEIISDKPYREVETNEEVVPAVQNEVVANVEKHGVRFEHLTRLESERTEVIKQIDALQKLETEGVTNPMLTERHEQLNSINKEIAGEKRMIALGYDVAIPHYDEIAKSPEEILKPNIAEDVSPKLEPEKIQTQIEQKTEQLDRVTKLKSAAVSFEYNEKGDIVNGRVNLSMQSRGNGREFRVKDFDSVIEKAPMTGYRENSKLKINWTENQFRTLPKRAIETQDRELSGHLKVYEELNKQGHIKEANFVLKTIHDKIDQAEKLVGANVFDRSKFPSLNKN